MLDKIVSLDLDSDEETLAKRPKLDMDASVNTHDSAKAVPLRIPRQPMASGYILFLNEHRHRAEKQLSRGRRRPVFQEVVDVVMGRWRELCEADRDTYEERARMSREGWEARVQECGVADEVGLSEDECVEVKEHVEVEEQVEVEVQVDADSTVKLSGAARRDIVGENLKGKSLGAVHPLHNPIKYDPRDRRYMFHGTNGRGQTFSFQTTVKKSGGNKSVAEYIARLCHDKFKAGVGKEDLIKYREDLYAACDTLICSADIAKKSAG